MKTIVSKFRFDLEELIKEEVLSKDLANKMFLTIKNDAVVVKDILHRMREENKGNDDSFSGFGYIPSMAQFHSEVEAQKYDDVCDHTLYKEEAEFDVYFLDAYQNHDDFLNHLSPCGEDTWHRLILFVGKENE